MLQSVIIAVAGIAFGSGLTMAIIFYNFVVGSRLFDSKIDGRVAQVEREIKQIHARESERAVAFEAVRKDISTIAITIARVEEKIGFLREEQRSSQ